VVTEQVALYGTLTGEQRAPAPEPEVEAPAEEGARVLRMPPRSTRRRRAEGS
jgi:hypothetical protein